MTRPRSYTTIHDHRIKDHPRSHVQFIHSAYYITSKLHIPKFEVLYKFIQILTSYHFKYHSSEWGSSFLGKNFETDKKKILKSPFAEAFKRTNLSCPCKCALILMDHISGLTLKRVKSVHSSDGINFYYVTNLGISGTLGGIPVW